MSKVVINELTLTNIGAAIREKTGKNDLIAPGDMPAEIRAIESGGGGSVEVDPIVLTGSCNYACRGAIAGNYIKLFGDTVSTQDVTSGDEMFYSSPLEVIPFDINGKENATSHGAYDDMFAYCQKLESIPKIKNIYPSGIASMFNHCDRLRELPEDLGESWNWSRLHSYGYASLSGIFSYCYSLRKIPAFFLSQLRDGTVSKSSTYLPYSGFVNCYALDELNNLPVCTISGYTSNLFSNLLSNCYRVQSFTFEVNEDGTPKAAQWRNQTINFANIFGYDPYENLLIYNSGITKEKKVTDDATYQALKNDPDWYSTKIEYSRYNHDSAVETINSLPDTTAYLTSGTNTIRFAGNMGSATDGGAINTLTEEEIAVAAAKGWTVTLV